jgi:hypothetical protein
MMAIGLLLGVPAVFMGTMKPIFTPVEMPGN